MPLLSRFNALHRSLDQLNDLAKKTLTDYLKKNEGMEVVIHFWNEASKPTAFPYTKVFDQCLEDGTVVELADGRLFLPVKVFLSDMVNVMMSGFVFGNPTEEPVELFADSAKSIESLIYFYQEYC